MAKVSGRKRMRVIFQADDAFHHGWVLRIEGTVMLIDAGVELAPDTPVQVHLFPKVELDGMEMLWARVVRCCQDVMVPADAHFRYLIALEVALNDGARRTLEVASPEMPQAVPPPPPRLWRRNRPMTHDLGVIEMALGR